MGFRIGRNGAQYTYDEPRFVPASGGGGGLIATYYADNGANDIAFNAGGAQTIIAEVKGVVIAAGQKVIVHATAWIHNSASGSQLADVQILQNATVVDEMENNLASSLEGGTNATVTRVFELTPAPGTYSYTLSGAQSSNIGSELTVFGTGSTPNGTPGGRLTVEVVSV